MKCLYNNGVGDKTFTTADKSLHIETGICFVALARVKKSKDKKANEGETKS